MFAIRLGRASGLAVTSWFLDSTSVSTHNAALAPFGLVLYLKATIFNAMTTWFNDGQIEALCVKKVKWEENKGSIMRCEKTLF